MSFRAVGVDLKRIYGDRVVSRITAHVMGHTMDFTGIKDYRVNHYDESQC
ncbi:hypothetical protein [Secundilactobacillus similis]|nr:hypothetical protein [Secundilactobacillus similis]